MENPAPKKGKGLRKVEREIPDTETVRGNRFELYALKGDSNERPLARAEDGSFIVDEKGVFVREKGRISRKGLLYRTAGCCRKVWNLGLVHLLLGLEEKARVCGYAGLCSLLVEWKRVHPYLAEVPSQALQQTLKELSSAFSAFLRKEKGKPRFKRRGDDVTIRFPDVSQFSVDARGFLTLPKLGRLRLRGFRPLEGKIISCSITLSASGRVHASLPTRTETARTRPSAPAGTAAGFDFGVSGSTGQAISSDGARFGPSEAQERRIAKRLRFIEREQRRLSRMEKGSRNRAKAKRRIARSHERVANIRRDATHKATASIAQSYAFVGIEDVSSRRLQEKNASEGKHGLAGGIAGSLWHPFKTQLAYKVREAGGTALTVPAHHTSTTCIEPGCVNYLKSSPSLRKGRLFRCPACGTMEDSEEHAARTVLLLARNPNIKLGADCPERPLVSGPTAEALGNPETPPARA